MARLGIGHIGKLFGRSIQPFPSIFRSPSAWLSIYEVTVFQNVFDLRGEKQIFEILGHPGGDAAALAEPFPNLGTVCCGLLLLQQKVGPVHEIPGRPANGTVGGDGAPHHILNNEPLGIFQVLVLALDVKSDQTVEEIHGSAMVEEVQQTIQIEDPCPRHPVSLRYVLGQQNVYQVARNRQSRAGRSSAPPCQ